MLGLGTIRPGRTIYVPFESFALATGASITISGFSTADIKCFKDGNATARASTSGYALLDSDGIDFSSITGIHGFSIDLSDNTTADFWQAGAMYFVVVSTITVDSPTMSFLAAHFKIGYDAAVLNTFIATLTTQTSFTLNMGPAEDDALNGSVVVIHDAASAVQQAYGIVADYTGSTKTVTLVAAPTFTIAAKDNVCFFPPALQPTAWGRTFNVGSTGVGESNMIQMGGVAQSATDLKDFADDGYDPSTNKVQGVVLTDTTTTVTNRVTANTDQIEGSDATNQIRDSILNDATRFAGANIDAAVSSRLAPTTAGRTLDVAATGEAGLDFDNIKDATGAHTLTNIRVPNVTLTDTVTTYTGNTPQTGDSFARIGATGSGLTSLATAADLTTVLNRLGAFTGSGLNTLLGFLRAMMRKDAALTPSDVGGTYDNTTDSLEALEEMLSGGGGGLDAAGVRAAVGLATANLDTQLSGIQSDTDNLQTRLPAALVSGRMDSHVGSIADGVLAAAKFASGAFDAVWSVAARILTAGTNIVLAKGTGVTGFTDLDAAGVRSAVGLATANLDTQLDALPTNSDLATALAGADDAVLAAIAALNNLSSAGAQAAAAAALAAYGAATPAQVATEIADALSVDTYAEPGQGAPAATASLASKLGYLYKFMRNKVTQSTTETAVYNDGETVVDHKATTADTGTVFSRDTFVSGP